MDIPFLGVSMGKAEYPADAGSVDGLLQVADKIMYRVKKNR
jgi:GGDEF domain-containing protein